LVASKNVSSLILFDTNVLMSNSDPNKWQTGLKEPLIIITWSSIGEIARLREKKDKPDTQQQARGALDALLWISDHGPSDKGVYIQDVGWVIVLPSPPGDLLEPEIKKLLPIKEMCHGTDTTLILIQRELDRCFPLLPVIGFTGDKLYAVLARTLGLTVHNGQELPADLSKYSRKITAGLTVDPDKELAAAVKRIEERAIKVDLVLTGKRLDKHYTFEDTDGDNRISVVIAEGYGQLDIPESGRIGFLWSLPYQPGPPKNLAIHPAGGYPENNCGYSSYGLGLAARVDYLGRDIEVPHSLDTALISRISEFDGLQAASDMPSLLNPLCGAEQLMKTALCMENWEKDKRDDKNMEEFTNNLFKLWEDEDVFSDYEAFKQYCINTLKSTKEHNLSSFLDNVFSTWEIGYKISFALPPSDAM